MFDQVPVAVERLALCLETQRRIGASHTLLHLRRLVAACLRLTTVEEAGGGELRRAASSLARPLKELDDALAADRLEHAAILTATQQLAFIQLQLGRLAASVVTEGGV